MSASDINISCIILAGGEGKRVGGQDKGLIDYRGRPLIEHVIDSVSHQVDDIVISANRNIKRYNTYGASVISDSNDIYRGPLAGLAASIPACRHELILAVPCDMPNLPMDLAETLANELHEQKISIAQNQGSLQLAILFNRSLLPSISESLLNDDLRLLGWVKRHSPSIVDFDNPDSFANLNTSEEHR